MRATTEPETPSLAGRTQAATEKGSCRAKFARSPRSAAVSFLITGAGPNLPPAAQAIGSGDEPLRPAGRRAASSSPLPSFSGKCAVSFSAIEPSSSITGVAEASHCSKAGRAEPRASFRLPEAVAISPGKESQRGRSASVGTTRTGPLSFTLPSFGAWVVFRKNAAIE